MARPQLPCKVCGSDEPRPPRSQQPATRGGWCAACIEADPPRAIGERDEKGKTCFGCKTKKPWDAFARSGESFQSRCRECQKKRWDSLSNEQRRNYYSAYDVRNKVKRSEYQKERYRENPDAIRAITYKNRYSISLEQYEALLTEQGGVCAICKKPPGQRRLSVDHCHKEKEVRGLLCNNCNVGLGHFKDDIRLLEGAIKYLSF